MRADEPVDLRLVPAALGVWAVASVAVAAPAAVVGTCGAVLGAGALAAALGPLRAGRRPAAAGRAGTPPGRRDRARAAHGRPDPEPAAPVVDVRTATRAQAVLVLGAVAVLLLALAVQLRARDAGDLRALAADGARVRLVGVVRSTPRPLDQDASTGGPGTVRFLLAARSVAGAGPTGAAVEVLAPGSAAGLAYGTRVEVEVRLSPARDPAGRAVVRARAVGDVAVRAPPVAGLRWTERLRSGLVATARGVPGDAGALLPAVAVGDTRGVGDLEDAMRASGLAHLTAVSGAHFSLLGGVVLALAARCAVPRRARWLPVGLAMVGFVALVQPGASVVRAAVMGAVGVLGLVVGRPARSVPALAAAVVVLLVVDPWLARDIGFVLSVAATAGIALLAGPLARRWDRSTPGGAAADARGGPSLLATSLAVPVAAQAVCAPVVLLLSPDVPTYAVPANVAAAPAVAPATVGGLLAALLGPWWPGAAVVCAQVAGAACWWIAAVARTAAGLPGARLTWAGGGVGVVLLAVACAAAVVLVLRCRRDVAP